MLRPERRIKSILDQATLGGIDLMEVVLTPEEIARVILAAVAGGAHIRDVDAGEKAYHYSSGNWGPGYVSIKGMVGDQPAFALLVRQLALKVAGNTNFDFINGQVTGGVPPSWDLRRHLQNLQGREIAWCYTRESRKPGGTRELITGIDNIATDENNPYIPLGATGVVMEELVNFANTTVNGANILRDSGFVCGEGFAILEYGNPMANADLEANGVCLASLITLTDFLDASEPLGVFSAKAIESYRFFLRDPQGWMDHYGYHKEEHAK